VRRLDHYWYSRNLISTLLTPVAWTFCLLVSVRRLLYRVGLLPSYRPPVPVVIIGNISVGGTGKTPAVAAVADILRRAGYTPGLVSRGYGGAAESWPQPVSAESDPAVVGDEPVLLAGRTDCPMSVGPDRPEAVRFLLREHPEVDVIIADDGLQHYSLERDVEVAVIDGTRGLGNGACLPAGPLREPQGRLRHVDFVLINGGEAGAISGYPMTLSGDEAVNLSDARRLPLAALREEKIHAVAGIGSPERFFRVLERVGLNVVEHPFPDHHRFAEIDLSFGDEAPVLMTEKDAVKCRRFVRPGYWYLPVEAELPGEFNKLLVERVKGQR